MGEGHEEAYGSVIRDVDGLRDRFGEVMRQSKANLGGASGPTARAQGGGEGDNVPESKGGGRLNGMGRGWGWGWNGEASGVTWCVAASLVLSIGIAHLSRIMRDLVAMWCLVVPNAALQDGRTNVWGYSVPCSIVVFSVHFVTWHAGCLVFEVLDRLHLCQRYKITRGEGVSYVELVPRVLANEFLILLPTMLLAQAAGVMFVGTPRHGPLRVLVDAVGVGYAHDLVFYVAHRYALHSRWGYRWFRHDLHHRTKAECAASSMYMAPADFVLEIIMPYAAWPLLVSRLDLTSNCLLVTLGGLGALYEHSGYDFAPRLQSTRMHASHHASGMVAFSEGVGSPGLMDRIMRTSWSSQPTKKVVAAKTAPDVRGDQGSSPRGREL